MGIRDGPQRGPKEYGCLFNAIFAWWGIRIFPCVFILDGETPDTTNLYLIGPDQPFGLDLKSIINPGSVGQPRDHNPLSSYLIYDDQDEFPWTYHRVPYDVEAVQETDHCSRVTYPACSKIE